MIRHILLVRFQSDAEYGAIEAVKAAFQKIREKIEGVQSVEWGENESPEGKNQGFTHCIFMTFADSSARDRYLPHPEHQALISIFHPVIDDIIVFDYSVQSASRPNTQ